VEIGSSMSSVSRCPLLCGQNVPIRILCPFTIPLRVIWTIAGLGRRDQETEPSKAAEVPCPALNRASYKLPQSTHHRHSRHALMLWPCPSCPSRPATSTARLLAPLLPGCPGQLVIPHLQPHHSCHVLVLFLMAHSFSTLRCFLPVPPAPTRRVR
jgi:hypothetical protein